MRGLSILVSFWLVLLSRLVFAAEASEVWWAGGIAPIRFFTSTHTDDNLIRVLEVSVDTVRCFQSTSPSWTVSAKNVRGAAAISPNNAVVFHRVDDGVDKIQVRYLASGVLREEFEYPMVPANVQIVAESANRIYIVHGQSLDELTRDSNGVWSRTYRWNLVYGCGYLSYTSLVLSGSNIVVNEDLSKVVNVFSRTAKSQTPIKTFSSASSSDRFVDLALSTTGAYLAMARLNQIVIVRTSNWSLAASRVPPGEVQSIDWFADGDLAIAHKTGETTVALSRLPSQGSVEWTTPSYSKPNGFPSIATSRGGDTAFFAGGQPMFIVSNGALGGWLGRTGRINFICPAEERVFVFNNQNEIIVYDPVNGTRMDFEGLGLFAAQGAAYGSGRLVWSDTGTTKILTGDNLTLVKTILKGATSHEGGYRTVAASRGTVPSAGSGLAAIASPNGVFLYRLTNGSTFLSISQFLSDYCFVQFSNNGQRFVAIRKNGEAKIWSTSGFPGSTQAEATVNLVGFSTAAMSPDGNSLLVSNLSGNVVKYTRSGAGVWSLAGSVQVTTNAVIESLSFAPDGSRFLASVVNSVGGQIEIFEHATLSRQIFFENRGLCRTATYGHSGQTIYHAGYTSANEPTDGLLRTIWNPYRASGAWTLTADDTSLEIDVPFELTLTLSAPAPANGFSVPISVWAPERINVPSAVVFNAGETTKVFTGVATDYGANIISAAKNGSVAKVTVYVR